MSYVTNDDTLLPLPLEFAKKVEDYARVIGPWMISDEWEEEDEDDIEEQPDENPSLWEER